VHSGHSVAPQQSRTHRCWIDIGHGCWIEIAQLPVAHARNRAQCNTVPQSTVHRPQGELGCTLPEGHGLMSGCSLFTIARVSVRQFIPGCEVPAGNAGDVLPFATENAFRVMCPCDRLLRHVVVASCHMIHVGLRTRRHSGPGALLLQCLLTFAASIVRGGACSPSPQPAEA
jgi:hypothetical protein